MYIYIYLLMFSGKCSIKFKKTWKQKNTNLGDIYMHVNCLIYLNILLKIYVLHGNFWNILLKYFPVSDTKHEKAESSTRELAVNYNNGTNIENNSTGSFLSSLFSSKTEKFCISISLSILLPNLIQPDCFLTSIIYISNKVYSVSRQRKGVAETETSLTSEEWSDLVL